MITGLNTLTQIHDWIEMKKQIEKYVKCFTKIGDERSKRFYEWVLDNAQYFHQSKKGVKRGEQKECYYNSQLADPQLEYYEGWGITKGVGFPIEHAFNVKNGVVHDLTWKDGVHYLGVKIPRYWVNKKLVELKIATNLLGRYYLEKIEKGGAQ
jgi:hypothetical protein